jgi:hypothetical protein
VKWLWSLYPALAAISEIESVVDRSCVAAHSHRTRRTYSPTETP